MAVGMPSTQNAKCRFSEHHTQTTRAMQTGQLGARNHLHVVLLSVTVIIGHYRCHLGVRQRGWLEL